MRRKIKRKLAKMFSARRSENSAKPRLEPKKPKQIISPRFNIPFSPETLERK